MKSTVMFQITAAILLTVIIAAWLGSTFGTYLITVLPEDILNWLEGAFPLLSILLLLAAPIIVIAITRNIKPRK